MHDHPVLKKLQYKGQSPVLVVNAPASFDEVVAAMGAKVHRTPQDKYAYVHVFVTSQAEAAELLGPAADSLEGDGLLWISYPKKASKRFVSDISRDSAGWEPLAQRNFEGVRQVAIDDDWSALRFRHVDAIKTLTRSFAHSEKGKARTSTNT